MKVIIISKAGYTGRDGRKFGFREVADYDDRLASKLVSHGIAVPAPVPEPEPKPKKAAPKVETAEVAPPENAAKRTAKPKARSSSPAKKG